MHPFEAADTGLTIADGITNVVTWIFLAGVAIKKDTPIAFLCSPALHALDRDTSALRALQAAASVTPISRIPRRSEIA